MKRYFQDRLEQIVLSDSQSTPYEASFMVDDLAQYPHCLYKYRSCDQEYNFEMLEEEYLWASLPNSFSDPTDSLINWDIQTNYRQICRWLCQHSAEMIYYRIPPEGMSPCKQGQTLQRYIEAQKAYAYSDGRYDMRRVKSKLLVETKKLPKDIQGEIKSFFDALEGPDLQATADLLVKKTFGDMTEFLREKARICCLTSRKDNQKMWEEYAQMYTGFVVEYDLARTKKHAEVAQVLFQTFPVSYHKRMPKVPLLPFLELWFQKHYYKQNVDIYDSMLKLYQQMLVKKYDYRAEEEWRILTGQSKISLPIISAVYMGYRIAEKDEQRLREICTRKNICLYKQRFDLIRGEMTFDLLQGEGKTS